MKIENGQLQLKVYLTIDKLREHNYISNEVFIEMYSCVKKIFKTIKNNYGENYNILNSPFNIDFLIKYKKPIGGKFYYMQN